MTSSKEKQLRSQQKIKLACETKVFDFFDTAQSTIITAFPDASLVTSESVKTSLEIAITKQFEICKNWVTNIFETAIQVSTSSEYDDSPIEAIHFTPKIALKIFRDLLKVLSENGSLSDNSLIFVEAVGIALAIDFQSIDSSIEQVQYERRKEFTERLLEELTEEQRYWVALMLWKAIHIDGKVDYREYKYFENIMCLIHFEQKVLTQLKGDNDKPIKFSKSFVDAELCVHIFRYIVEIVMIDEKYTSQEAQFIQELGNLFEYDKTQQDSIIQPVSAALMLRRALFPY
ncbi:MAG: putative tellurite resistance protein B-like protein [bacterium]|jgi:uncharacterized tellurite resistance protein B-like protein